MPMLHKHIRYCCRSKFMVPSCVINDGRTDMRALAWPPGCTGTYDGRYDVFWNAVGCLSLGEQYKQSG